jgi:predicted ATPase
MRAYAMDKLRASGELDAIASRHGRVRSERAAARVGGGVQAHLFEASEPANAA